jgi:hypothetical protein
MLMNIGKNNLASRWELGLASMTTYFNNKAIIKVGSSNVRSIPHYETNQCHGFPT